MISHAVKAPFGVPFCLWETPNYDILIFEACVGAKRERGQEP